MEKIETKPQLENFVTSNWKKINAYIDQQMDKLPIPIYSSVDIRESKDKFAPVDLNFYPAGWNNVCALDLEYASEQIENYISSLDFNVKKLGIIVESNTKNKFYLDHLAYLKRLFTENNIDVDFLSLDEKIFNDSNSIELESHSKFEIKIFKRDLNNYDLILLNNDQSQPINIDWETVKPPIMPSPHVGWNRREKNKHFNYYSKVVNQFADHFQINPNLLEAKFKTVENLDFQNKEGLDDLSGAVKSLQNEVGADKKIFIKASQGTYGMGIMVVDSPDDITSMNRKTRNKMDIGKNKIKFTSALVQEGIDTILKYDEMPAEVAIYLINGKSVGGFMRANSKKDESSNLNSRGMVFKKFCISEIRENQDHKMKEAIYSIVARLSTLAGGMEIYDERN